MDGVRAQTPLFLQRELVEEVKTIMSGMLFKKPKSDQVIPITVFAQSLPIPPRPDYENTESDGIEYVDEGAEEAVFDCPWCLVKLEQGAVAEINGRQSVKVALCFGIFNDDPKNQGHLEILNLCQKIYERFAKTPLLDNQYTCSGVFDWALQDDDTFPYFFGAILTTFEFQGLKRENKFI